MLWYWPKKEKTQKYRPVEQDRKPKDKLIYLWHFLSLTKETRIYNGEKTASSRNGAGKTGTATCKRMKLGHFLIPHTKTNSKWIKDLNVRSETIKLLEENMDSTLFDINHSKILFDSPPRIKQKIKTKINKWN